MKHTNAHRMYRRPTRTSHGERGAVLIVSLILLVVLTLLGVSVMNMTQLEEKMASNSQEIVQTFQSAETALQVAYANPAAWREINAATTGALTIPSTVGRQDVATYSVQVVASEAAPVGYDANSQKIHFNFGATGQTSTGMATAVVHGGGFRIAPNAGGYLKE